jgi:signal transduction histidine kinase/CheY-like chemotaxis protein
MIHIDSIYMIGSALIQLVFIAFLLGHPNKSKEKSSMILAMTPWMLFLFLFGIGVAQHGGLPNEPEGEFPFVFKLTVIPIFLLAYFYVRFFYHFLDRESDWFLKGLLGLDLFFLFIYPFFPEIGDRRSPWLIRTQVVYFTIPVLMGLSLLIREALKGTVFSVWFPWIGQPKSERAKLRAQLMAGAQVGVILIYFFALLIGVTLFQLWPHLEAAIHSANGILQPLLWGWIILRYNYLDMGVEEAAEGIFHSMADPVFILSQEGRIRRSNPPADDLMAAYGLKRKDSVSRLIPSYRRDVLRFETALEAAAGSLVFDCSQSFVRKDDEILGNVLIMRDVTQEREIDKMKSEFTSTISHELRTPLTSILGFARIIQKRMDSVIFPKFTGESKKELRARKQVAKNLEVIISEGQRLTSLINNLLDISKMESGKVEWNFSKEELTGVIEQSVAATQALFDGKALDFVQDYPEDMPLVVADADRIIQVLVNLISNAVKFTDQGSVTIRVRSVPPDVHVSVVDTGDGISAPNLPKVFEKYKQVGDVMTNKPKGTGLGLPISKEIVEGHGGRIWADSDLGQGSTFTFTLPIYVQSKIGLVKQTLPEIIALLPALETPPEAEKIRILVVEDEAPIRQMVRQALEPIGAKVLEAKDGLEALDLVRSKPPSLIISDVMMPRMNGFDFAAVVKNDPKTMSIPLVMLTVIPDAQRGFGIGVDRYLQKPIEPDVLREEIKDALKQSRKERSVLLLGQGDRMEELGGQIEQQGRPLVRASRVDEIAALQGTVLAAVMVEEGLCKAQELRTALGNIGQANALVRVLSGEGGAE